MRTSSTSSAPDQRTSNSVPVTFDHERPRIDRPLRVGTVDDVHEAPPFSRPMRAPFASTPATRPRVPARKSNLAAVRKLDGGGLVGFRAVHVTALAHRGTRDGVRESRWPAQPPQARCSQGKNDDGGHGDDPHRTVARRLRSARERYAKALFAGHVDALGHFARDRLVDQLGDLSSVGS